MRHCCFLTCENPAEYEIIGAGPEGAPYDTTDSCPDHIGALLGTPTDWLAAGGRPNERWMIVAITIPVPA